jgi:hypothetical protein
MKKTMMYSLLLASIMAFSLTAGEKKQYGEKLTLKETTKISDIIANPEKYNGKKVKVEGAIVGVCEKRGCWIRISGDKEFEAIRFKVEDGVIVFPMEVKGNNVVAEGVVSVTTMTKEQLIEQGKHQAKEHGTEFDPSTVTGPKTTLQINGTGAVVVTK